MGYFGKIIKNTVIMFAVGVALAAIAPYVLAPIAVALGGTAPSVGIAWTGVFFGGFGGLHAAIEPIINRLAGDRPRHTVEHKSVRSAPVIISAPGHAPVIADEVSPTHFQDKYAADRPVDGSFTDKIAASNAHVQEHSV